MRYTPKPSSLINLSRNPARRDALLRAIEANLRNLGATAREVDLLRQSAGNRLESSLVIASMLARDEDQRSRDGDSGRLKD